MIKKEPRYIPGERWTSSLKEIAPDSQLLERHPELEDLKIGYLFDENARGSYHYHTKRILIYAPDQKSFRRILQHEVEHRVQELKGGPQGASVEYNEVEGTPNHKRAIKKYLETPGEVLARKAGEMPFEEYFQFPGFGPKPPQEKSGLLKKLASKIFIGFVILALIFYPTITGNTILNPSATKFTWITLFCLITGFIFFRKYLQKYL